MAWNFLAGMRELSTKWSESASANLSGVQLEACLLEDRLLYSATAMPIEGLEGGGPTGFEISQSEIDAILDCINSELSGPAVTVVDSSLAINGTVSSQDAAALVSAVTETIDALPTTTVASVTPDPPEAVIRHDVAFVDANLDNLQQLVDQLQASYEQPHGELEVVLIDHNSSGIDQINSFFAQSETDFSSIQLVTHGSSGQFQLGSDWINIHTLADHSQQLLMWQDSLTEDADLLIYGCQVASTADGQQLGLELAQLLNVDVALSTDATGTAAHGGDWDLEFQVGMIETQHSVQVDVAGAWDGLLATYTVTNTNDSGAGSLRQALIDAKANAGADTIVFNIGTGVQTITLTSGQLADIDHVVTIDATTQAGFSGQPLIVLNGNGSYADGLRLTAGSSGSTIRGLVIRSFTDDGIEIQSSSNLVVGNYIGTTQAGTAAAGNDIGIHIAGGANNTIGGTSEADRNVIWGNEGKQISLNVGTSGAIIQGNRLGTSSIAGNVNSSVAEFQRLEVVIVDTATQDYLQLVDDLFGNADQTRHIDVILLDSNRDGVEQITELLAGYQQGSIDAVHFVSHGVAGSVKLGGTWLTSDVLSTDAAQIASWGNALTADGDLLFYGCDFASNSEGQLLVGMLSNLTGADVAASIDDTGNSQLGGNWTLEYAVGTIDSQVSFSLGIQQNWLHVLAAETVRDNFSSLSYSNNNGTQSWSTGWVENDSGGGGASAGKFFVGGGLLNVGESVVGGNIYREANLTGVLTATFSFDLVTNNLGGGGNFSVQVSGNGGSSYVNLLTVTNATSTGTKSFDITSYIASNTRIRFYDNNGGGKEILVDNVQIAYNTNTAPVLDATRSPVLSAILEDAGAPSGAVGTLVSSLVDFATPSGQVDNITDPDSGAALGIAITATNSTNGTWYYSTNSGSTWNAMGSVSNTSARLLFADAATRLYFQPNSDWNGSISDAITFRAWDRSDNLTNGSLASTATNGGITAFSTATDTASLSVTAVNDAPVTSTSGSTTAYTENALPTVVAPVLTITDIDSPDFSGGALTVTISANGTSNDRLMIAPSGAITVVGTGVYNSGTLVGTMSGGTGTTPLVITFNANSTPAIAQAVGQCVSYFNVSDNPSTANRTIDFVVTDGDGGTSNTSQKLVSVAAVADAPIAVEDRYGLKFDGIDDYVNLGSGASLAATNTMTVESWVRPTAYPTSGNIIVNREGEYEVGINSTGKLRWAFSNTNPGWAWHDTGYTLALNQWAHIAVSYDNGVISTYVNGTLVEAYYGSGAIGDAYPVLNELRIGGRSNNPSGQYFAGDIDEVRIWNISRTQGQIQTNLASSLVGNESGLAGYWRFNEGTGTTTADLTANTNIGTLVDGGAGTAGPQWTGYSTNQNTSLSILAASGVLSNDIDGEANTLTVSQVNGSGANVGSAFTLPSGASLTLTTTGSFTYNPNAAFNYLATGQTATDSFTYQVSDGTGNFATATAFITVTGLNDNPTAVFDTATAVEAGGTANGTAGTNPTGNVLTNDTDVDTGDTKTVSGVATGVVGSASTNVGSSVVGSYGSINIAANGAYTYTVDNSNATVQALRTSANTINDVFTYTMRDTAGLTSTTQITVTIQGANDAPTDITGTLTIAENSANASNVGTVATTDIDAGDGFSYALTNSAGGRFAINAATGQVTVANGSLLDFETNSTHNITVQVTDTAGATFSKVMTVNVTNTNDAPVLDNSGNMTFTTITEDQTTNTGNTVANIILSAGGDRITDQDASAVEGIAITATTNGNGTWQYSTDGGSTWSSVGAVSNTSALLLRATDSLRFVPNAQNATTGDVTFRAWDTTTGTFGTKVDVSTNGGTTAFSAATEVASITVTAVNDAPTITNGYTHTLATTNENTTSSGTLASAILTGSTWADVDTTPSSGLAITSVTGNGTWQYSTDGTTWTNFGAVSATNALLITSTSQVRYIPDNNNGETATFGYKAWDQTSGTASVNGTPGYATTASSGGTTAFSTNSATAQIVVSNVNDAPTITNAYTHTLATTNENTTSSGTLASAILTGSTWADVDTSPSSGLAITSVTGNGTWQYSTDGTTWTNFGAVSATNALLISSTSQVRYIPDSNNGETATFGYKAWDQTSGTASVNGTPGYATTASSGGTTAFSSSSATAQIVVSSLNDAPLLDNAGNMTLTTVTEDNTSNSGNTVANIILSAGGDRITDVDTGAIEGIAITATTNGNGTWQYSTDGGTTWTAVGTVSNTSALLLRATDSLRFVPDAQNATTGDVTFRAWDTTTGTFGTKVDVSTNGGTTAFSTATEVASITVTAVNDAPTLGFTGTIGMTSTNEDTTSPATLISDILLSGVRGDVDSSALSGIAVTSISASGTFQYSTDGVTWTNFGSVSGASSLLLNSSSRVRFIPNGNNGESATFTYRAWDQTSGTASSNGTPGYADSTSNGGTTAYSSQSGSVQCFVTSVNDAPVLSDTALSITIAEDAGVPTGIVGSLISSFTGGISDVDTGSVKGIAIAASVETNGTWYYTTNNGTNWTAVGTVNATSSLLLADNSNTRLYFAPGLNYNGTSTSALTIRGWDQTSGTAGTKVDTSSNGGITAFSSATDVVDVSVTAVNDAPVAVSDTATAVEAGGTANGTAGTNPTGNVLTNDTDVDAGDTKTVSGVAAGVVGSASTNVGSAVTGSFGSINIAANGVYTYTVDNNNATVQALRTSANTINDVFTYTMRDTAGLTSTTQITVTIQGANDAPTDITGTLTIAENSANASNVGTVATTDIDSGDGFTYALTNNAGGRFAINSSTGQVTVANGSLLDFETNTSHSITVQVTDTAGATFSKALTVNVTNVNEGPVAVLDTATAVEAGGTANGTAGTNPTGNVLTNDTDVDSGDTKTVSGVAAGVVGSSSTNVGSAVTGSFGSITIAANGAYTYTVDNNNATVQALRTSANTINDVFTYTMRDTAGLTSTTQITVTIQGANDAPTDITGTLTIAENSANASNVGTVATTDIDSGDGFTYALTNNAGGRFAINSSTGQVTVANGSLLDFETNTSHSITVQVTDTAGATFSKALTVNVTNVNEGPVAVVDTATAVEAGGTANGTAGTNPTGNVLTNDTDVDSGDTKTVSGVAAGVVGSASTNVGSAVTGSFGSITIAANGAYTYTVDNNNATVQALRTSANTINDVFTYTMRDTAGLTSTTQITVTIQGANDAPTDITGTLTIAENSANASNVGTVATTDIDAGDGFTYALTNNAGGRFAINAATGQVTVANGSLLDFETNTSHSITVQVTDTAGATFSKALTVNVTNVNETPVAVVDTATAVEAGGTANGTAGTNPTGNVLTNDTDVDSGDTKTVSGVAAGVVGSASTNVGSSVVGSFGAITIAANGAYTYTVDNNNATVQALRTSADTINDVFTYTMRDTAGLTSTTQITVTIQGANDAPTDITGTLTIAENSANTSAVGTVATTDIDSGDGFTYALTNNAGGRFAINAATGQVTVANGSLLDFETNASHSITVQVTDTAGATFSKALTVNVTNVNETPVAVVDTATAVEAGGTANGTAGTNPTGNVLTNDTDVDSGDTKTVSGVAAGVVGSASTNVGSSVVGSFGSITIAANGAYTYTVDNNNATVQALRTSANTINDVFTYTMRDTAGLTSTTQITVTIQGANDAPTDITGTLTIAENSANASNVGTVATTDIDAGDGFTYALTNNAGGRFAINAATGQVTVANGSLLDFETNTSHSITVQVTDTAGATFSKALTVNVTNVNETPVAVVDTATAVEAGGTANGTAGTNPTGNVLTNDTDVDSGDTKTVSGVAAGVVGSASTNVGSAVVGSFGSITIAANGAYTYTVDNNNATVQALRTSADTINDVFTYTMRDTAGLTSTTQITVTIQGANDAPTDITGTLTIAENSANASAVGTVATTDIDSGDGFTYALTNNAGGRFAINAATGQVTVANGSLLDFETNTSHSITVQVTDTAGATFSKALTVNVTNVNEGPVAVLDTAMAVEAGGTANGTAGTNPTGNVLTNDTDVDSGDTKTVSGVAAGVVGSASTNVGSAVVGSFGSINIAANGAYTYTVDNNNATVQALRTSADTINDVFTYTMRDTAGLTSTTQITVTIQGANDAPTDITGTLTIAENSANASAVGTVATTDIDSGDGFTYALTNNAGGRFAINAATGQVTVANGSLLDFETNTSHSITVQVTDTAGATFSKALTVNVTNVNETPVAVVDTATAVEAGGTANGTAGTNPTGNVLTNDTDVDSGDTKTVSGVAAGVVGSASTNVGSAVVGSFGSITIAANGAYTYTVDNNNATVQALRTSADTINDVFTYTMRDTAGLTSTTQITVTIQGANDAPTDITGTLTIAENSANASAVGTVATTDIDSGDGFTYALTNNAGGRFAINAATGQVTVANGSLLDFETNTSHSITVQVTDTAGATFSKALTVNVTNVNEGPVAVLDTAMAVEAGGTANGTAGTNPTGNVLTNDTDVDSGDTKTVSGVAAGVVGSASTNVGSAVTGSFGSINIAANGAYTYTVDNNNATVQALRTSSDTINDVFTYTMRDTAGLTSTTQITVTIQGANDAPTAVVDTATAVEAGGVANGAAGTDPTGNVLANDTDVDSGDTKTVSGVAAGVVGSTSTNVGSAVTGLYGSINIAAGGAYTYIVDNSNATVQALANSGQSIQDVFTYTVTDTAGATSSTQITVTIQGANDTPTIISNGGGSTASISMDENITAVTTVVSSDVDAGTTFTYSIIGGADAARFSITAGGSLAFVAAPDFETPTDVGGNNIYDVLVQVSDGSLTTTQAIAVTITDVSNFLIVTTATDNNDSGIASGASYNIEWLNANKGADTSVSLREAIIAANNTAGTDTVNFSIAGTGVKTINMASALPSITDTIIINGYSQTGSSANTLAVGNDAVLNVVLSGASAGAGANGLTLAAGSAGSTIAGLVIDNFSQYGISVSSANNSIAGNFIGVNSAGSAAAGNGYGVVINNVSGNTVGGTTAAARNVISGNTSDGVYITGTSATGNTIQGNYIGTSASGMTAVANGATGIHITGGAAGNSIGGISAGSGNLISGNTSSGVFIDASNTTVKGNFIGTNAAGTGAIANGSNGSATGGIFVASGTGSAIGGTTTAERNVLSGNGGAGLWIEGTTGSHIIQGNYIGVDVNGDTALSNGRWGIVLNSGDMTNIQVGGTAAGAGNIISGNASSSGGVLIGGNASGIVLEGNRIGIGATTNTALATMQAAGVRVQASATNTRIGGTATGAGNIIARNGSVGVTIVGNTSGTTVQGNAIYGNNGLAIDLGGDGSTTNDGALTTGQPNQLMDTPVLANANLVGNDLTVAGYVGSAANQSTFAGSRVEFFKTTASGSVFLGALTTDSSGNFTGTLDVTGLGLSQSDPVIATATDPNGNTSEFSVSFEANATPTANSDSNTAVEAGGVLNGNAGTNPSGNVLSNDTDPNTTDTKTVSGVAAGTLASAVGSVGSTVTGSYGSIQIAANGSYTYTIDNNNSTVQALRTSGQTVTDVFTYTMRDTGGLTSTTQVTITIQGANDAPVAVSDSGIAIEAGGLANGSAGSNAVGNVLSNDTDVDAGDTKNVAGVAAGTVASTSGSVGASVTGTYGSVSLAADGSYTYIVDNSNAAVQALRTSGQSLTDVFSYTVVDTSGLISTTQLTITINGANDAPTAVSDNAIADEAGGLSNATAGNNPTGNVLSNDTDVDSNANGETKTVSGVSAGVQISATGSVGSGVAGSYGSITIAADGSYAYTVDNSNATVQALRTTGQTLNDVFTYTVSDAGGLTSSTQITVTIRGANDTPTSVADTASATEAGGLANASVGSNPTGNVLSNDTDVDSGDSKTVSGVAAGVQAVAVGSVGSNVTGSYGSIMIAADGTYTYTVDNSNSAVEALRTFSDTLTDTFTYTMVDTAGLTSTTQIVVTIHGQNDTLVAVNDSFIAVEAGGLYNATTGTTPTGNLISNDTDVDAGDTKSVIGVQFGAASSASGSVGAAVFGAYGSIVVAVDGSFTYTVDNNSAAVQSLRTASDTLTEVFTYTMEDTAGSSSTATVTVTIQGANDTPTAIADSGIAIEAGGLSNGSAGANATGNVLTNDTDPDSVVNGETKTVVGVVAGTQAHASGNVASTVTGSYGSISISADGSYSYTVDNSNTTVQALRTMGQTIADVFSYTMIDALGVASTAQVTITIQGSNDTPYDLTSAPMTIAENLANGSMVGTIAAADVDAGDSFNYQLLDSAGGRFTINSSTGIVTVADGSQLNYEAATSHSITVQVTDAAGATFNKSFTISLTDVNEYNVTSVSDVDGSSNIVNENATVGTTVGLTAYASDADATNNTVTYSMVNSDGGRFAIDSNTGIVTVAGAIDREADGASRNITIRATSVDGSFTEQSFAINIADVDEFDVTIPIDSNATANAIAENSVNGALVGITASALDADATSNMITYTLVNDDGGRFAIDSNTGIVTVAGAIDRETVGATRNITVRATSADGSFTDQAFAIDIVDVDEFDVTVPLDSDVASNVIAENSANGTLVGITAAAFDADATNSAITFQLDDSAGGRFAIDANTGVVTVANSSLIDYEAATNHSITVRATSADGSFETQSFTINLTDVNETTVSAVSDANSASNFVFENVAIGTTVGITGLATDADGTDTVSYSLDDDAGGRFAIDSVTGVVTVAGAIDREAAAAYNITIRATSTDSSSSTQTVAITIGDVDEFDTSTPIDIQTITNTVAENAATGTVVGITARASDADATNNAISYRLDDTAAGRFTIDANTGVITVANGSKLDFEAAASHSIIVRATSVDGSYATQVFTVNVSNVNEAPSATSYTYAINSVQQLVVSSAAIQAGLSDPELDALSTVVVSGPSHGSLTMLSDGSFVYAPDAGFTGQDQFSYRAMDGQLVSPTATVTIVVSLPPVNNGSGGTEPSGGSSSNQSNSNSGSSTTAATQEKTTNEGGNKVTAMVSNGDEGVTESRNNDARQGANETLVGQNGVSALDSEAKEKEASIDVAAAQLGDLSWSLTSLSSYEARSEHLIDAMRLAVRRLGDSVWLPNEETLTAAEKQEERPFSFAEPAKWTVISTGIVIWAFRLGHVITTFAYTAGALVQFDPLTVIQAAKAKTDDKDLDTLSETMFDASYKKPHRS